MTRRICVAALAIVLLAATAWAGQPEPQEAFVPASEVPPGEQLPGGVMVVIAYSFIWVALMVYVWSIWRRLGKVEDEIKTLERRTAQRNPTR